MYACTSWEQSE